MHIYYSLKCYNLSMKRVIAAMGLVLLAVGMWFSFQDYKQWKHEDTKKYGQGPAELYMAAEEMSQKYEQQQLQFRFRYPANWKLSFSMPYSAVVTRAGQSKTILTWRQLFGTGRIQAFSLQKSDVSSGSAPVLVGWLGTSTKATTDLVTDELMTLGAQQWIQQGDREYMNTGLHIWTVLTLRKGSEEVKRGYWVSGEKLIMLEMRYETGKDTLYQRTFEAFLTNFVLTN